MGKIVVEIKDKFVAQAFQRFCIYNGILWGGNNEQKIKSDLVDVTICVEFFGESYSMFQGYYKGEPKYFLPAEWDKATTAIIEMIKAGEKVWTDKDMMSFAICWKTRCSYSTADNSEIEQALSQFKINNSK